MLSVKCSFFKSPFFILVFVPPLSVSACLWCWDGLTLTQCPAISVPQRHWSDPHTLSYLLWVLPCCRWVGPLEHHGAFIPIWTLCTEGLIGIVFHFSSKYVPYVLRPQRPANTAILNWGELTLRHAPPSEVMQRYTSVAWHSLSPLPPTLRYAQKGPLESSWLFNRLLYRWNEPSSGDFSSYSLSFQDFEHAGSERFFFLLKKHQTQVSGWTDANLTPCYCFPPNTTLHSPPQFVHPWESFFCLLQSGQFSVLDWLPDQSHSSLLNCGHEDPPSRAPVVELLASEVLCWE